MNTDIHRLLDEAFEGITMTPEARDLKEEVRANLMARTDELEATGLTPADAARKAIAELGPVEDLMDAPAESGATPTAGELHTRNKVRPRPGFVVRATLLSVLAAGGLTLAVLAGLGVVAGGAAATVAYGLIASAALGFVTGDSLLQETATNYAMPLSRAVGYGAATFAVLGALSLFAGFAVNTTLVGLAIAGGGVLLASLGLFSWLGATQTNRHKEWVRSQQTPPTRFETDQAAAARFGMYTAAVWTVGLVAAIVLAIVFAWWWALIVFAVCIAVMMLMLATMLFGAETQHRP